ncbi:HlyD family secretion protein [Pedosphaera parvula]|uniref:Secretion protein HlyD family protein n=1 Tax=Pedosphaera parvula (strain Ellin514) TaxID=320771 RepID=B9XBR0_PEDPL|nr:HlyD family secretion protein [Pedosphaera parvula]EEF62945.1 secretion protein HlyD family protein [Pedosphaera parvula Ellin514]
MSNTTELPKEPDAINKPIAANGESRGLDSNKQRSNRKAVRWVIFSVVILGVLAWVGNFVYHAFLYEETDDAYVAGHVHQVSPEVDGRVKEVLVKENQTVKAGDVLVRLDPLEYEIGLQKAEANLAQASAQALQAKAAVSQAGAQLLEAQSHAVQAEAQVRQTSAQLELAGHNQERNLQLQTSNGAISKSDVDATHSALDSAQAAADAATANLNAIKAGVTAAQAQRESAEAMEVAAKAAIAADEAAVREAKRKLSYTAIVAPADGRIGNKNVEPGNRVQSGQTLFAMVEPEVWIVANFKETQLAKMHAGQSVDISIDAVPGKTFHGVLDSLAPASGAQFALLPPDNATGNFTKVVQRVPVRISFEQGSVRELMDQLRPGLSTIINVRVR